MFKGIHHIGITVTDLDKSERFYCETFGFRPVKSYDNAEGGLRGSVLELEGQKIELIESPHPRGNDSLNDLHTIGIRHIAFAVPDIQEAYARLKSMDLEINEPEMGKSGAMYAHLLDPDGIQLEIYEVK